ncbi:hypothetical protein BREVNS_1538 [Brevinematales bacterium NS]|nr:hypothetical protein [Brevinematales bacterium]QJR22288.1 hypothetical protein BREVNS_1538 [Brevinematales bacterium NS]
MLRWMRIGLFCLMGSFLYGGVDVLYRWQYFSRPAVSFLNPDNVLGLYSDMEGFWGFFWWEKISFLDERIRVKFSDYMRVYPTSESVVLSNRMNEGYVSCSFSDWLMVTMGKEVIKNGVGYVNNPTDYFGKKNLDTTLSKEKFEKYREGIMGFNVQLMWEGITLQGVFAPRLVMEDTSGWEYLLSPQETNGWLFRTRWDMRGLEMTSLLFYDNQWRGGVNLTYVIGDNLELHCEGSISEKGSSYELGKEDVYGGPVVIGTTNIIVEREKKWPLSFVIGGHYTLSDLGITIMGEYYYNGHGLSSVEWKKTCETVESSMRNFEATNVFAMASLQTIKSFVDRYGFGGLVQHYAMVRVSKEWQNYVKGEITCLQNLVDWSGYCIHRIVKENPDVQWEINFGFAYGEEKSEFGMVIDKFQVGAGITVFL